MEPHDEWVDPAQHKYTQDRCRVNVQLRPNKVISFACRKKHGRFKCLLAESNRAIPKQKHKGIQTFS